MCQDVMATVRARCPDCKAVLEVPYSWCDENRGFVDERGRLDEAFAERLLREHAEQKPILHPTVLAEHHMMRRPA